MFLIIILIKSNCNGLRREIVKLNGLTINDLPIRYKLVIHFLMISILPTILIGILVNFTVNQIISKQVNENTLQLIGKTNKSLESYVSEIQNITYYISFHPLVQDFLREQPSLHQETEQQLYEIKKFLRGFTTLHAEIAGILIVNARNQYLSNEIVPKYANDLTEETWYHQAIANRGIFELIGHPKGRNIVSYIAYTDDEVVTVVRAILDPATQETLGVVLIDLKLRVIAETLKDTRLGQSGFLMLIDEKGEQVYAPNNPITEQIQATWFLQDTQGDFNKRIGNQEVQFIYRKSNFTNWSVVGVFAKSESVAEVREIRFYLVSFIFLVIFLGVTASYFLSHSLSRPILRLTQFMSRVEAGDLHIRSIDDRTDEIGMLSRGFNQMLTHIGKLIVLVKTKERQKRESELRILHANIKPHFLYNTLDTIQWLAKKKGATEVSSLVDALSTFFRIGLSKGKEIIPFEDEIEHVRSYLKIQQTRYSYKLQHDIFMSPLLKSCFVIKLILQPIVENAIYHGIKERRGVGHIQIIADIIDQQLVIQVMDDGVGMNEDQLESLYQRLRRVAQEFTPNQTDDLHRDPTSTEYGSALESALEPAYESPHSSEHASVYGSSGYGLINVQARLLYSFGEPYGLTIKSIPHGGTTVTIIHPIISGDQRSKT